MSDYSCSQIMVTDFINKEINGSGNSHKSKPKKNSFQIQQLINEIGRMLAEGKLDREIMEELHIKRSQYYEYKSKLFQESAELFDELHNQHRNSLIYHKELLSERLTRLYKQAELDLIQNSVTEGGNNRAPIYLAAQNIAINISKLESEGLRVLANKQARQMRDLPSSTRMREVDDSPIRNGSGTEMDASNKNSEYDESEIY